MQQAVPFVEVRDLPSAASFYSAITQPLKLRYMSANASSIVFGDTTSSSPKAVLEVKRVFTGTPIRPSRVVLSAQSPSVISAFRAAALRADPDLVVDWDGKSRAEITDYDGNRIEVVYSGDGYSSKHRGSTVSSLSPREPRTMMRRSTITSPMETTPRETARGASSNSGFSSILGATAVGVAVGGALTYAMMSRDRQPSSYQEYESPNPFQRRASYSDPANSRPAYVESSPSKKYPPPSYGARYAQIEAPAARSRVLEDIDDGRSSHYGAGSLNRRSSEAGSTRRPHMLADVEYISNTGSRNAAGQRLLMETEYRSQMGEEDRRSYAASKYTASPSMSPSKYRAESTHRSSRDSSRQRVPRPAEAETYVSARTARSVSTVRPPPSAVERSGRSRANSYVSARESKASWEDWDDDDVASLAPSDSISCIDDDERSRRSHRQSSRSSHAPSMIGRYRKVVNEFDGKHRPKYGSEYQY
ncbi:hypothetical protein F4804DRAFT_311332 [Jackrogersella minutella]|nr:hypothetical protein F4804DRAFT_311332 [Jackrogersella minutella]